MVLNRGHKPYEMVMKGLETASAQRKNPPKIYPNDPCSCGSGKKNIRNAVAKEASNHSQGFRPFLRAGPRFNYIKCYKNHVFPEKQNN